MHETIFSMMMEKERLDRRINALIVKHFFSDLPQITYTYLLSHTSGASVTLSHDQGRILFTCYFENFVAQETCAENDTPGNLMVECHVIAPFILSINGCLKKIILSESAEGIGFVWDSSSPIDIRQWKPACQAFTATCPT